MKRRAKDRARCIAARTKRRIIAIVNVKFRPKSIGEHVKFEGC